MFKEALLLNKGGVVRLFILLFFVNFLFSKTLLYVPKDFDKNLSKDFEIKRYSNIKEVNFNNFVILSYNQIPLLFEKNLTIIAPLGEVDEYILTHKLPLNEIKKIANLDFASKILFDSVNSHYKQVNGNFNDLLNGKIDAIVVDKQIDKEGIYDFDIKEFGIEFNRYFLVSSKSFIKNHKELVEKVNEIFEKRCDFREDLIYKTLLLSSLYLDKKVNFNTILFENYNLSKEKKEEPLIVDVTPNWPPFDIYKDNHLYGIGVDFWKLIAKKANLQYRFNVVPYWSNVLSDIKEKKADLTINTSETPDRKKYALFSKPYISFPLAIICRSDENFNSISEINSIAVGKNFTAEKLMKKHYLDLNYIETKTTFDALNLVKDKKVDCAVDILPTILWIINKNHLMNLQIAFKTPFKFNVQIMVRKDKFDLVQAINNAIDKITPREKEKILNRYISTIIVEKSSFSNKLVIIVGVLGILILLFLYVKYKKVNKEAHFDELTEILNRRGLDEKLKEINRGVILFFDIDHFKKINDTYGHEFGDYVLKEIGKILKTLFRKTDIVARWGGEEFIVILPDADYQDGLKLAERLRHFIEHYKFKGVKITISIGVSEFDNIKEFEKALKIADEMLYHAKRSGRNQVKGYK